MKQKTHIKRNNAKMDILNEASRKGHITEATNEAYLKALDKIYKYESETLYKRDKLTRE